ncbi:DUF432 domain-containing protein [Neptuniibacter halophilus]|uniref:DUF432 domain-containing protein n=1 Tax=Neptuniibacter halophilus TaxID=651666 RepID=UPI002573CBBF|nr:DUF432 domain-containing protein [Neptuniibacter halophilus]
MQTGEVQQALNLEEKTWYAMSLGDLTLYLQQKGSELLTATAYQSNDAPPLCQVLHPVEQLADGVKIKERLYIGDPEEQYRIQLQLADKPYQVKTDTPIRIGPNGHLVLYVSTPLWVQLISTSGQVMSEYPAVSPRLSWVGSSTTEGALCYSSKSTAPADITQVQRREHRAVTAMELVNSGTAPLSVERLSLPLNMLSLYYASGEGFWTESVRFRIEPGSGETTIVASAKPPLDIGEAKLISEPRESGKSSRLKTAMNLIMG